MREPIEPTDTQQVTPMDEGKSFKAEVEEILAKQALALNYEYGMTSRILGTEAADGVHKIQLLLDLTHSSMEFDMIFTVTFGDEPTGGVSWELAAPEAAGVWAESHRSAEEFRRAVAGLPYYVQGFFAGRASRTAVESPTSGEA